MNKSPLPNKSLGQHWLHDATSLRAMVQAAAVNNTDTVLEIGPGLGTLTNYLCRASKQVIAVEYDANLATRLPTRVSYPNLSIVTQDILRFDFSSLPVTYKLVANIPYYLTSNLLRVLSETNNPPQHVALLVQKEVAQRITAQPGSMSLLSISVQFYWQAELGALVPAYLFTPPPKVDSQILILRRRTTELFPGINTKIFFRIVKAGFSQRRKTLLNTMSSGLHVAKSEAEIAILAAGLEPTLRPQNLSLEQWYALYQVFVDKI